MNESAVLVESFSLMLIGMGIVFTFLLVLVGALRIMSALALRLAPPEPLPLPAIPGSIHQDAPDDLIAVIAASITEYRKHH